ncbi:patatin family protein [Clostridium sp. AN503]|uniref:patatin-like phospholipase family protein n=1 Tax=Clostridium sp. AN503 TaxID=3160598 RepID=UPI003457AB85
MGLKKTGLVLEGGGMRGIYSAGVLDVFLEHGISFDGVIGVSAGAIHGCSFVSEQKGRSIRYYKKYSRDKRFMSFWNLLRTGDIAGERFCYHDLPEKLDPYDYAAFNRSGTEFYVTCSNLETGNAEYLRIHDMKKQIDLMRASASLPYVSRTVEMDGMKLLDGGCCDSIPVMAFRQMGFEKTVVVLTRHRGYRKEPESTRLAGIVYRKYPKFVKALENRHNTYNETIRRIEELEQAGEIFVIRPSRELSIGRTEHDPNRLQEVYDIGRRDALCRMRDLSAWLMAEDARQKKSS